MKYAVMIFAYKVEFPNLPVRTVLFSVEAESIKSAVIDAFGSEHNVKLVSEEWATEVFVVPTEGTPGQTVVFHEHDSGDAPIDL